MSFYCVKKEDDYIKRIYGVIYCATNIINGKKYIGQTIRDLSIRKREHINQARNNGEMIIHQAIRKYGEENFEWSIIDQAYNQEDLDSKEIYWIDYYDTYREGGYNGALGGQFNLSDCPEEMSAMRGGREFLVYNLNGDFIKETTSQTAFAEEAGVSIKAINHVLTGRRNQTSNYVLIFKDEFNDEKLRCRINNAKGRLRDRGFYVFGKSNLGFIGEWNNREQCQNDIKVSRATITKHLNSKNAKNRTKFLFYYIDELPSQYKYKIRDVI